VQRVFGPCFEARKQTEDARKPGVPDIFFTELRQVCLLSHAPST